MIDRRILLEAALTLCPEERAELVREIWDSLAERSETPTLTAAQAEELERCWQAYQADPKADDDWAAARARVLESRGGGLRTGKS